MTGGITHSPTDLAPGTKMLSQSLSSYRSQLTGGHSLSSGRSMTSEKSRLRRLLVNCLERF